MLGALFQPIHRLDNFKHILKHIFFAGMDDPGVRSHAQKFSGLLPSTDKLGTSKLLALSLQHNHELTHVYERL